MTKEHTSDVVIQTLREILEAWPLYRKFSYSCQSNPTDLPLIIRLHCHDCGHEQNWVHLRPKEEVEARNRYFRDRSAAATGGVSKLGPPPCDYGVGHAQYRCRNCAQNPQHCEFFYYWSQTSFTNEWIFQKVGQFPPIDERVEPELEKQLDDENLEFFKNAIRMRNFNLGIASMAYLRRVVENRMNDLLNLIEEALQTLDLEGKSNDEMLEKIKALKTSKNFTNKVEYAEKILPKHLIVGGHNPVHLLHEVTSEGLHSKSDDECVEVFDRVRAAFEFLFKKLRVDIDEAKAAAASFGSLAKTKGQLES